MRRVVRVRRHRLPVCRSSVVILTDVHRQCPQLAALGAPTRESGIHTARLHASALQVSMGVVCPTHFLERCHRRSVGHVPPGGYPESHAYSTNISGCANNARRLIPVSDPFCLTRSQHARGNSVYIMIRVDARALPHLDTLLALRNDLHPPPHLSSSSAPCSPAYLHINFLHLYYHLHQCSLSAAQCKAPARITAGHTQCSTPTQRQGYPGCMQAH